MKRFSYSLQKILELRAFERKEAEAELGKVNAQIALVHRELESIAEHWRETQQQMDADYKDTMLMADGHSYLVFLTQKKENCLERLALLQMEAEKKKDIVRKAMQKEKVLEKLKDSRLAAWKADVLNEEELIVDDVVTARYGLNSGMPNRQ